MSITSVHPHKGYLNTEFRIHSDSFVPLSYYVCNKLDYDKQNFIIDGIVYPYEPHSIRISTPGEYVVCFEDGSLTSVVVEDGYKFGGGSYKASFIHDTCPWVFIVMHDRTYFYNRLTEESYVEVISPDYITFVSDDFVLFSNKGDDLKTLYSLKEQKPIICIEDIVYMDNHYVIWDVGNNGKHRLMFFSLEIQDSNIEVGCDHYVVNSESKQIFYIHDKKLYRIDLEEEFSYTFLSEIKGTFITFVKSELCVSCDVRTNSDLQILNMSSCEVSTLKYGGVLSSVNGNCLIDISKERHSIYQFNLKESGFPNATIEGQYVEVYLYPTLWDVFYTIKTTTIHKSLGSYHVNEETFLKSLNSKVNHKLVSDIGQAVINDHRFCFYNSNESYVCGKAYSGSGYVKGGQIRVYKDIVHLKLDDSTYTLSRNGYWDGKCEVNYDYEYFAKFGVVKDKDTGVYKSLSGREYGKRLSCNHVDEYIEFDDIRIYANGRTVSTKFRNINLSYDYKYGIKVTKDYNGTLSGDIILCTLNNGDYEERAILKSLFDSSTYKNVLFSDNAEQVMYQTGNDAVVMNVATGHCEKYPSLSYIKHINGIRLFFETASSLQPRLINPITRQYINCNSMPDFQFVSPDGKLYADTRLQDYIEYYFFETGELISREEYNKLVERFIYPVGVAKDHDSYIRVVQERKQFIRDNFDFLNSRYRNIFKNDNVENSWDKSILEESSVSFVRRVIGLRGIAVIRNTETGSEVTRISLGDPLSYINYVSFSYDSRYVALAGYRDFSHGLFLVYDLECRKILFAEQTPRAVWTTAFSIHGAIAGYTSEPISFFATKPDEYDRTEKISNRNFLTFSPDGNYFALSTQGYVSKYDINGVERAEWGHQPSSKVYIKSIYNNEDLYEFDDLADTGIEDVGKKNSVASVSFSSDNRKLMMVSNDGVVVIRNLHFNEKEQSDTLLVNSLDDLPF